MSSSLLSLGTHVDKDTLYLAAKILPLPKPNRSTFHLALLLDTSGSMEGDRITALKRTIHLLIDSLTDKDVLTLISYNSDATVLANALVVGENREQLHTMITSIAADGGTNMEAAILALRTQKSLDSVFILTDGHINQGITASCGLLTLLTLSIPLGVPVNTLGFGSDVNARMLRDMALRSCGTYTYADKDELLPAIIGDIVGGLQSTVGKMGVMTIPAGWTCCELGRVLDEKYMIGTLIADKPQWIVMSAAAGTPMPPLNFTWMEGNLHYMVAYTTNVVSEIDVAAQRDRCMVAKAFEAANDEVDKGSLNNANDILLAAKTSLDSSIAKNTNFVVQLYAQIAQMIEELRTVPPAAVASRMASGTATLAGQRGITSCGDPCSFSSPLQVNTSVNMTIRYTQAAEEVADV